MRLRDSWALLRQAFTEWNSDNVPRLGAALAYYSVFSLPPFLILVIAIASFVFGQKAAQMGIMDEIENTVGAPVARAIGDVLANNSEPLQSGAATIIGVAILFVAAAAVFGQLQDALNTIWRVQRKSSEGFWGLVRDRFFSLTMVMGCAFLFLVSLVISTILSAMNGWMLNRSLPGGALLWQGVNLVVSFGINTLLFALIFRIVPDAEIEWRDVWLGAALTAILFNLGKFLLGWYLGQASTTSAYGVAGSLVVILLWVYYASQVLLFGAAFTRVCAMRRDATVRPAANAVEVNVPSREPSPPKAA
jgi:membrane protein